MSDRADINSVLGQMRALQMQVQQRAEMSGVANPMQVTEGEEPRGEFADVLKMAVDKVNDQQATAKKLAEAYERGDPSVDLPQLMIQVQKASVAFEAMTQVRNRLVSAYEDVSNMPI